MSFSPVGHTCSIDMSRLMDVFLSRNTGYDCKITPSVPSVSDPAALGVNGVVAKDRVTGQIVFAGHFPEGEDIVNIIRAIKKTTTPVTLKDYRPSVDMVEYIIKFKKEQEESHFKENFL